MTNINTFPTSNIEIEAITSEVTIPVEYSPVEETAVSVLEDVINQDDYFATADRLIEKDQAEERENQHQRSIRRARHLGRAGLRH